MLEKYHKLQLKHKTTDELKVALQTILEELPQEHVNKAVANFTKCLTAYMAVAEKWWSLQASLSISKSASSSHHQQTGSFQHHQQTTGEDNARNAEKWGLSCIFSRPRQSNAAVDAAPTTTTVI